MLKFEPGEDNDECEPHCPDAEIVGSMKYKFACLGETCDKIFVKWKPCKEHILVCCGITKASNQLLVCYGSSSKGKKGKRMAIRSSLKARKHWVER